MHKNKVILEYIYKFKVTYETKEDLKYVKKRLREEPIYGLIGFQYDCYRIQKGRIHIKEVKPCTKT